MHRAAACFAAAAAALPLQGPADSKGVPALNLTTLLTALSRLLGAAPAPAVASPELVTAQVDLALHVLSGGDASRAAASENHDNMQVSPRHLPQVVEFASLCRCGCYWPARLLVDSTPKCSYYLIDLLTSFLACVVSAKRRVLACRQLLCKK